MAGDTGFFSALRRTHGGPGLFDGLRVRVFLAVLAAALPVIGGLGYYVWHQHQALLINDERAATNLVQLTAAYDRTLLNDARDVLLTLANSPVLRDGRWDECRGYLAILLGHLPRYLNVGVINADGRLACSGLPDPDSLGSQLGDRPYFQKAMQTSEVVVGEFLLGRISRIPTMVLAARVPGDSGLTAGVAYVSLNLGYLLAGAAIPDLLPGSRLWILDRYGHVLQRIPGDASHLGERLTPYPLLSDALFRTGYTGADDEDWAVFALAAGPRGDPRGLSVRYEMPTSALYAKARQALWNGLVLVGLLLCVTLLIAFNLMQRSLRRSHERERLLSQLMDVTAEAIVGLDASGRVVIANQACADRLGFSRPEELLGLAFHAHFQHRHEDGRIMLESESQIRKGCSGGTRVHVDDEVLWRQDGSCFPVEYWVYPIREDNRLGFCLVTFLDRTERRAQQLALAFQASHDPLTKLFNRGEIQHRLHDAMRGAGDGSLTLVIANLDDFKEVNRALGHDVGDRLLQVAAQRFQAVLDESSLLARLGADEFAWVLATGDEAHARAQVSALQISIREPFALNDLQIRISCSFGMAMYPAHARQPDKLLRYADMAMRRAKRDGLGIAVFNQQDRSRVDDRLLLRAELRNALAQGQFVLHMQPKIALAQAGRSLGAPLGFEALARWHHPKRGMIPPAQFIPIIEVSDLIHPFTQWVIDQALGACVRFQEIHPGATIAVNISARNLMDEQFPQQVEAALDQHGLAPELLELEVTESVIMADPARALRTLYALHALGVRLSIDDFGTGYSSFAYLNRLPVDALKIDQSFVAGVVDDPDLRAIVRSIIEMSHTLGLEVIAEGIESQGIQDLLLTLGCDVGQGYWIGYPQPELQARQWLQSAHDASA